MLWPNKDVDKVYPTSKASTRKDPDVMEVDAMQTSTSTSKTGKGKGKAKATKAIDTNKPKCLLCGFTHTWNNCYYNNKNKDKHTKT